MSKHPYQLLFYIGDTVPQLPSHTTVLDVTPKTASPANVIKAVEDTKLTAADMRTRSLFVYDKDAGKPMSWKTLVGYAGLCGFANRMLDFSNMQEVFTAQTAHKALSGIVKAIEKPETLQGAIQIGKKHPNEKIFSLENLKNLSIEDATIIRYSRKCYLNVEDLDVTEALKLLVGIVVLRSRRGVDHLPVLTRKDVTQQQYEAGLLLAEHAYDAQELEKVEEPSLDSRNSVDLEDLSRETAELRRNNKTDNRDALVETVEPSARQKQLIQAADTEMLVVLNMLGSEQNIETGYWRCTRPERHRNGDANPSCVVEDNTMRCFRCDAEPVDALRLVMDTLNLSPDDAANKLLELQQT